MCCARDMAKAISLCCWDGRAGSAAALQCCGQGCPVPNDPSRAHLLRPGSHCPPHFALRTHCPSARTHVDLQSAHAPLALCTEDCSFTCRGSMPQPASAHVISRVWMVCQGLPLCTIGRDWSGSVRDTEKASCLTIHSLSQPALLIWFQSSASWQVYGRRTPFLCLLCSFRTLLPCTKARAPSPSLARWHARCKICGSRGAYVVAPPRAKRVSDCAARGDRIVLQRYRHRNISAQFSRASPSHISHAEPHAPCSSTSRISPISSPRPRTNKAPTHVTSPLALTAQHTQGPYIYPRRSTMIPLPLPQHHSP